MTTIRFGLSVLLLLLLLERPVLAQVQRVVDTPSQTTSSVLLSAVTANTTGTAIDASGYSVVGLLVECTGCSGGTTVNWQGAPTNVSGNFVGLLANRLGTPTLSSGTQVAGVTVWQVPMQSMRYLRAVVSSYSAGTVTVTAFLSMADPQPLLSAVNLSSVETTVPVIGTSTAGLPQSGGSLVVAGNDSTNVRTLRTTTAGRMEVDLSGTAANATAIKVDGSAVTQPVSGTVTVNGTVTANAGTGTFTTSGTGTLFGHLGYLDTWNTLALGVLPALGVWPVTGSMPIDGSQLDNTTSGGYVLGAGGIRDDTSPGTVDEGSNGLVRITTNRAFHVNFRNASGTEIGTAAAPVRVDPTGTTTQPVTQSGTWTVQPGNTANTTPWLFTIQESGNPATVRNLSANDALNVAIVDSSGNQITSFGGSGGTAQNDNTAVAQITAGGALYDTTPPAITDGNVGLFRMNSSRQLQVDCVAGCSGSSFADNAAFTFGTTPISLMGGVFDDVGTNTATENSAAIARITTNKALHVNFRNASGTEIGTAAAPVRTDPTGTTTQPVSGTVTVGTFPDNEPINVAQMNGVAVSMGNGASGTGVQRVTIANDSTGTVAATQSGTWNVNNIAGTVSLPTGAATSANQTTEITALQLIDNLPNTLGSTTSGQSGALALGAVTTAAPSYTNAQSNALSLTTAGALRTDSSAVTQPVSGTVTVGTFPDNEPINVAQMNGVAVTMGNGTSGTGVQRVTIASDSTGQVTLAAGSQTIGALTAHQTVDQTRLNGQALASPDANSYQITANAATATSGAAASGCNILSTASTNSTSCKASAGNFFGYEIYNTTTTVYYLRLYNSSSAPTCSSATGFIRSIPIPPASASGQVGGAVSNQAVGVNFGTGIGYCITGGSTSTDNTNAAAGIFGEIRYK